MSSGKNQYVVRHGDKWGVRGEGNQRLTREFETQREAIDFGRGIARNQESELRIQGRDARFREAYSYGNDPFPRRAEHAKLQGQGHCAWARVGIDNDAMYQPRKRA
jgi:hypothetical protein